MRSSPGRSLAAFGPTVVLAIGGCGRIGYDLLPGEDAGAGDASESGRTPASSGGVTGSSGGDAATADGGDDAAGAARTDGTTGDANGASDSSGASDAGVTDGANAPDGTSGTDAANGSDGAGDACVVTNGGVERCDGLDNDCNGVIDDGSVCGSQCIGATYGGHAYAYCSTPRSFGDATTDCSAKSMRLARVDDAAENQFLGGLAFAAYPGVNTVTIWPWIGAADRATPGEWFWPDGTVFWSGTKSGSPVGGLFSNWASASPGDGSGTYCATVQHTASLAWVDRGCSNVQPYLCEAY